MKLTLNRKLYNTFVLKPKFFFLSKEIREKHDYDPEKYVEALFQEEIEYEKRMEALRKEQEEREERARKKQEELLKQKQEEERLEKEKEKKAAIKRNKERIKKQEEEQKRLYDERLEREENARYDNDFNLRNQNLYITNIGATICGLLCNLEKKYDAKINARQRVSADRANTTFILQIIKEGDTRVKYVSYSDVNANSISPFPNMINISAIESQIVTAVSAAVKEIEIQKVEEKLDRQKQKHNDIYSSCLTHEQICSTSISTIPIKNYDKIINEQEKKINELKKVLSDIQNTLKEPPLRYMSG